MADEAKARKSRRKLKVSYILIVLVVIIVAGFAVSRLILRAKLQSRLDALGASGYPATCAELDEWYAIPESAENAADTIVESFSNFCKWEEEKANLLPVVGKVELPPRTEALAQETKELVGRYLADNQAALELLHKGAAIEHSRYPIDLSKGFEALMPYLSDIRTGAKLMQLEAILHAEDSESESAARSITSMLGLGRSLAKEPLLISQLVRVACCGLAISTLEHAVNRTKFTDEQLVHLSRTLADAEDHSAMARAFAGERCAGVSIFKKPSPEILQLINGGSSQWNVMAIGLYKFAGLADMDAIAYVDFMNDYMKAMELAHPQRYKRVQAIEAKVEGTSRIHIILRMIMPALSRVSIVDTRGLAQLRTARTALAIERYRLATGRLPRTLAELIPAYLKTIPEDPFNGQDIQYRKHDVGFVVYSVDEDGNDDGGKEKLRKRGRSDEDADVTFIIQR
jgi:hypothetical protein